MIENMRIAARHYGFDASVAPLSDGALGALITFRPAGGGETENLFGAIATRHSNRKPYKREELPLEKRNTLFSDKSWFADCRIAFADQTSLQRTAKSLALDVLINLQNENLRKHFFQEVLWREEEQHSRSGLYVKTMEMVPPKSTVLKLLQNKRMAAFFKKLGLLEKILGENAKTIGSTALIGAVIVPNKDEAFVEAGKVVENLWLRTTQAGLSFQLLAGFVFLWQQAEFGDRSLFSDAERKRMGEAYNALGENFGMKDGEMIATAFRIGESSPPMAVSFTRPPEVYWE